MFKRFVLRLRQPETPPWSLWAALSAVVAAFAAIVLGSTFVFVAYCTDSANAPFCQAANFTPPAALTLLGWTLGGGITTAFVLTTRRTPEERAALRLTMPDTSLFLVLLVGLGLAIVLDIITIRLPGLLLPEPELLSLYGQPVSAPAGLLAGIFMVVAQPVAEELVFRGLLLPSLRQAVGVWPGLLLNAVLYGVFHLLAYPPAAQDANGLWYGLGLPFIGGLIFSIVRLYTGSTGAAMLTHAAFGLFAVLKLLALGG